jgi:peptidoglycan/xylan/chitin deacetylase (PgdA/CDA1 family)
VGAGIGRILLYHAIRDDDSFPALSRTNVSPARFEEQLACLRRHFHVRALDAVTGGRSSRSRRSVAVTFDDGYEDNYTEAYPRLKKQGIPVTFFLTVSMIEKDWEFPQGSYPGLSWEQLGEMQEDPLIGFGSHGLNHTSLIKLSREEAAVEIVASKVILEEKLSHPIDLFSYPHGRFNSEIAGLVREAGYRAAYSVVSGGQDEYSFRRILISGKDNMFRFRLKLSPLYWPLRKLV